MNKTIILALVAALPTFAQQDTTPALPTPPAPGVEQPRHWGAAGEMPARPSREDFHKKMLEKFDTNKDGQLNDEEKAAMKAEMPARPSREDFHKKMLEKFDTNKDGQLNDEEKAAMKAEMPKRGERPQGQRPGKGDKRGHRGERPEGQFPGANGEKPHFPKGEVPGKINKRVPQIPQEELEKLDTDKDGNVSQKELNAAHAKRGEGKHGKRGDRGPKRHRGQKPAEAPAGEHTPVTLPL